MLTNNFGSFYGTVYDSDVTLILNSQPSVIKSFKTINYEGASGCGTTFNDSKFW